MKYVQINTVPNGSTGGIMMNLHKKLLAEGHDSFVFWGRRRAAENDHEFNFGSELGFYLDALLTTIDGRAGFHSVANTRRLLTRLDEIDPDVVHLHNLHGYYLNIEMLFDWLRKHRCAVNWTLHDCWAFTGHCAYFTYINCSQWKSHCACIEPCRQTSTYPITISGRQVKRNFERKRRIFTSISPNRMRLITPSTWLKKLVKESFLSKYLVEVRHNTIDTDIFKPTPCDIRELYELEDKFIILGVASPWTRRKGLCDFEWLAEHLDDRFVVMLVGLSNKQIFFLPKNIIGLKRVNSAEELAGIYTAADLFVNPSIEETYGMTVAEAVACGTPVVVREGAACIEAAKNGVFSVVGPDLEDLRMTVIRSLEGVS